MKTKNINQYIQELERKISLLESDNNAIKQIKETFYKEMEEWKWRKSLNTDSTLLVLI